MSKLYVIISRWALKVPFNMIAGTRPRNVLDMSKRSLWSHFTQKNRWVDMTVTANAGPICLCTDTMRSFLSCIKGWFLMFFVVPWFFVVDFNPPLSKSRLICYHWKCLLKILAIWKIAGIGLDWWGRLPFHMLCLNIMVPTHYSRVLSQCALGSLPALS